TFPATMGTWSGAVVAPDGTIYWAAWDRKVYAISPAGAKIWELDVSDRPGVAALGADGTVYVTIAGGPLMAIRPNGTTKWLFLPGDYPTSVTVGADGIVYVGSGGNDGSIYALRPTDGSKIWQRSLGGLKCSPGPIGADGTLYATTQNGTLVALP